jgi:signal peptidase II
LQRKYKIVLALTPILVFIDQASKGMIREALSPARVITVLPGFLQFRYAENPGMAFGLLPNLPSAWRTPFFCTITLFALLIIVHLLRQAPDRAIKLPVALGMILSGALGNLTDRFRWGVVIDFIRAQIWPPANYYWPTFNLADSFITIGIALLILDTLFTKEESLLTEKEVEADRAPVEREEMEQEISGVIKSGSENRDRERPSS